MKIYKDYYKNYDRRDRCIWKGYIYMIPYEEWLFDILPKNFFKIGKTKFIIRNGFLLIEKKKFEKKYPEAKLIEKNIEIYDKNNEEYFK